MKIKNRLNKSEYSYNIINSVLRHKTLVVLIAFVISFLLGAFSYRYKVTNNLRIPRFSIKTYLRSLQYTPDTLILDIKHKELQKLAYFREKALNKGLLLRSPNDYVRGKLRYKSTTKKIKLRLKGDILDHLRGEDWSFRVKLKGKNTLFGMKKFSLQKPIVRNYLNPRFLERWDLSFNFNNLKLYFSTLG